MSKIENHPEFELMCDKKEQECSERGGDYVIEDDEVSCSNLDTIEQLEYAYKALDHIARVAAGSRTKSTRNEWIKQRAISALNKDDLWRFVNKPHGYHNSLEDDYSNKKVENPRLYVKCAQQYDQYVIVVDDKTEDLPF